MLIREAVDARLPLIQVRAKDLVNLPEVLSFVLNRPVVGYSAGAPANVVVAKGAVKPVSYHVVDAKAQVKPGTNDPLANPVALYNQFAKAQTSLVVVNRQQIFDEAFDAGELIAPRAFIRKTLSGFYKDEKLLDEMMSALGGLTLKEVVEVIRLAEVVQGTMTPQALMQTRAMLSPDMRGFSAVNTKMGLYLPMKALEDFSKENKRLFLGDDVHPDLVPRGVLLDGESGTGKTQGVKWLANQWGVPLYRLDPTVLGKYYGESEGNLQAILARVEAEAPCILFMDEVEKLFGGSHEEGRSVARLLNLILWQMQESRARVFYAMTSNRKQLLPPELIRPGRIDKVITFEGLSQLEGVKFGQAVLASFEKYDQLWDAGVKTDVVGLYKETDAGMRVPHAAITEAVKAAIKKAL